MSFQDNFIGPDGSNNYIYTGETETVSSNATYISYLEEIKEICDDISCSSLEGLGNFSDYEELFKLATIVSKLKLKLDLTSLGQVAAKANEIAELFRNLIAIFDTTINLISIEDLIKIRNSLCAIYTMLDTLENFGIIIENQFVIRNEWMACRLSNIMSCVYNHMDHIMCHNNCITGIPPHLLTNPFTEIQPQIDKFTDYAAQLDLFTQGLNISNEMH